MKNHDPELRVAIWRMVIEFLRAAYEAQFPKGNHFGADAEKLLVYGAAVTMQLDGAPARASKIAQYLDLPNQTARRHLDKLVRWGLLERQGRVYAQGGVAVGQVRFSQSYSDNINNPPEGPGVESASASKTLVGWTVGAGVEQAITPNWIIKAEYLYTDLGGFSASGILHDSTTTDFSNFTNSVGHLTSSTIRGGVNYKF
jgi:hypothetical protein